MSDILIKGMEMPKSCVECVFFIAQCYGCSLQFEDEEFNGIHLKKWKEVDSEEIDKGCPLVEVSPHGRLIDADKLKRDNPSHMEADVPYVTEVTVEEIIDDAPTVLEATE